MQGACMLASPELGFDPLLARFSRRKIVSYSKPPSPRCIFASNAGASNVRLLVSRASASRACIVWFKKDLRMDDHPGLVAAASSNYDAVIPLFVFDPLLLRGWSQSLINGLLIAVKDLRRALEGVGSGLIIRIGNTREVIQNLTLKANVVDVFTENEWEHDLETLVSSVQSVVFLRKWKTTLYQIQDLDVLPDNYLKYTAIQTSVVPPLLAPSSLPPLTPEIPTGILPSTQELEELVMLDRSQRLSPELQDYSSNECARETLTLLLEGRKQKPFKRRKRRPVWLRKVSAWFRKPRFHEKGLEFTEESQLCGSDALQALHAYLTFPQPVKDDWSMLRERMEQLQKIKGTSFRPIFHTVLALGTISLRRIYHEAMLYSERKWFSSQTVAAVIEEVNMIDWYNFLLEKSRVQEAVNGFHVKAWKWRGFLMQYVCYGDHGTAMVLVHGFGAFWQHYRDNIKELSRQGNRVWAITLLGFGRSEKPGIVLTELLWAELLRDFILEVVGEPVVLVGNSLGGYIAALVSGLWSPLVKSLILLNAAGVVDPDYQTIENPKIIEKTGIPRASSQVLLFLLQQQCSSAFKYCYPSRSERVDQWILGEALRASYDPGATSVLESMFYLRLPLPLNFLLDQYQGRTLVLQGVFDPLQNAFKKARTLKACCKNVTVNVVDAGHCPHDEVPEQVNRIISEWVKDTKSIAENTDSAMDCTHGGVQ